MREWISYELGNTQILWQAYEDYSFLFLRKSNISQVSASNRDSCSPWDRAGTSKTALWRAWRRGEGFRSLLWRRTRGGSSGTDCRWHWPRRRRLRDRRYRHEIHAPPNAVYAEAPPWPRVASPPPHGAGAQPRRRPGRKENPKTAWRRTKASLKFNRINLFKFKAERNESTLGVVTKMRSDQDNALTRHHLFYLLSFYKWKLFCTKPLCNTI